jgi:rare lipoprotein A
MRPKMLFLIILAILLLSFCSHRQKVKTEPVEQPEPKEVSGKKIEPVEIKKEITFEKEKTAIIKDIKTAPGGDVFQTGIASWYGDEFHGKRTSNGEIYDMYKLTAAHKTLPFNTLVEVKNLDNGERVLVRINDRGPFLKDRIIDLSFQAARKIGCDIDGTAPVSLRIVKPDSLGDKYTYTYKDTNTDTNAETTQKIEKEDIAITETEEFEESYTNKETAPDPEETPQENTKYYLQAGAFSERENAEKMLRYINIILSDTLFKIHFQEGLYKVISEALPSRAKAEKLKKILLDIDIDAFIKEL